MIIVNRIKLRKLTNTRDLGGIKTADGRVIKEGRLIRSGKLSKLPKGSVRALREIGVTTVVDLRIENERCASPDTVIDGCTYIHNPILCVPTFGITEELDLFTATEKESSRVKKEGERIKREFGSIDKYMVESYRSIVFSDASKAGLKAFLRLVIEEDGCILWHCASGKDRAGICAMLVESLLGVDEKTVLDDYMASARFWRKRYFLNKVVIVITPVSMSLKRILFGLMRIKRLYLETIIEEMKERYGGVEAYCKSELGVTDADVKRLKEKYLK